ncbi:hypothetical protein ACFL2I_08000, partial [Candidatus Omnitrophota bacterium]
MSHLDKRMFLFLLIIVVLFKLPIINMPYHWDALGGSIPGALWIYQHRFVPALGTLDFGHPQLFHEILAIIWSIFGYSIWLTHLVVIIFSFLGVYFTYRLGTDLKDRRTGIIAALLLFFSP